MKKCNLGFKILAAVSALTLWLCPLGYADEAVSQFKGEFISVAEDAIISAPNISAVDIYSVKWLQLSLDELLSFMYIEVDKDEMFVGQSLYDSEGGVYQTMVAEGSSENYGISLPTYTVLHYPQTEIGQMPFEILVNMAWGNYGYSCDTKTVNLLFDPSVRAEILNADVAVLPYTSEQALELARQFIEQYDHTLLGEPKVYGCNDYMGVPYYHVHFDTVFGELPLINATYGIDAYTKIILDNVTRRYGTQTVLNKINVSFEAGKIHGLIGRNGSGKTMLLKTICGFVRPTEGAVHVFGKRIGKDVDFPPSTGVVMDCMGFVPFYSGYRNLRTLAKMNCKNASKCAADAMTLMGLDYQNKKRVSKYSLGMYQRLQMAQAIMTNPKLLLLDEPFNGIDNAGVKELHKMLMDMRDKGVTIFLATHHEKDIKGLCDDVYEMDAGKIQPAGG